MLYSESKVLVIFIGNLSQNKFETNNNSDSKFITESIIQKNKPIIFINLDSSEMCEQFVINEYFNSFINDQSSELYKSYLQAFEYYKSHSIDISYYVQQIKSSNFLHIWIECGSDQEINENMAKYLLYLFKCLGRLRTLLQQFKCIPSLPVIVSENVEDQILWR